VRAEGAAQPAVEVIFDASGSMGKKLPDGTPRIDAAREVLKDFVTNVLPEGTPFALRAFGHIKPSSCDTRLEVPLAPLDPASATKAIDAIQPKLLSQTPLADSIAAVGEDLAGAPAGGTLLLLTDGEESCGGDPSAELRALRQRAAGVDVVIVSLGLDDPAVQARFSQLAEVAGGGYQDVRAVEELNDAVRGSRGRAFEVRDQAGDVVAEGVVGGESVEVPAGRYEVVVGSGFREQVRVGGGQAVEVAVGPD